MTTQGSRAEIYRGQRRNYPSQEVVPYYYFVLVSANGEPIATSEIYTQKHNATELIEKHFPAFEVVDLC
jgi:uncharacterized protein YegP (UPF0339 family)